MNLYEEYSIVQKQINQFRDNKIPVPKALYQRQYNTVKQINDTFEKQQREDISDYALGIRYNMMLKYFAEKLNLPVEEYKQKIRNFNFKLTGENLTDEEMLIKD